MTEQRVEVRGIRELSSALGRVDKGLKTEVKARFRGIADAVVRKAQGKVPRRSGRAASSIKARSSTRGASVAFGGQAAPYMPWLDFGGSTGRGHIPGVGGSGAIKRDWMGAPVGEGRYVYPAISEEREDTARAVDEALKLVLRQGGFEER